jgi:hypothetical protein
MIWVIETGATKLDTGATQLGLLQTQMRMSYSVEMACGSNEKTSGPIFIYLFLPQVQFGWRWDKIS